MIEWAIFIDGMFALAIGAVAFWGVRFMAGLWSIRRAQSMKLAEEEKRIILNRL